jgi:lipopolysaccharide biosynthesis glycosyltransferase
LSHQSQAASLPTPADPITVALAVDANYVPWAATLVRSCLQANPGQAVHFHILHDGSVDPDDQARLGSITAGGSSTLEILGVEPGRLAPLPSTPEFGPIVWLRFLIPELLPGTSRVLYLDSDTFVAGALRPLWETPLGQSPLAAVANVAEPAVRDHIAALGVGYPGGLFNSGVLLLDLDRMRAEGSADALFAFAHDHRDTLRWPDQDALNVVFARRWLPLHPRWNAQNSFWAWRTWSLEVFSETALLEATAHPGIRHFEGPSVAKPWHYLCPYPGRREYRAALAATPWAGTPPEDLTPATRLIRALPEGRRLAAYRRLLGWRARSGR